MMPHRLTCCDFNGGAMGCNQGRTCPVRMARAQSALATTTRRYPRSLADAFPDVRAPAIEFHPSPSLWKRISLFIRRRFYG